MAGFILNDAVMKVVLAELPLGQSVFVRGLFATALIAALAAWQGVLITPVARADRPRLFWRTAAEVGMTLCYLTALSLMPLANATAILQAMPLMVTLAAVLVLGERVGWRRWLAILAGFAGVLLIVRPGPAGFSGGALFALIALMLLVLRDVLTRLFDASLPSTFVAFITAGTITLVAGGMTANAPWAPMTGAQVGLLAGTAVLVLVGYLFSIMTMRVGDVAFVSPFRYTMLLWAMIVGFLAFGDIPDAMTVAGAAIVVAAGLFSFWRERVRAEAAQAGW
jgi:drug/metabolite transporter (DMT)-like permease